MAVKHSTTKNAKQALPTSPRANPTPQPAHPNPTTAPDPVTNGKRKKKKKGKGKSSGAPPPANPRPDFDDDGDDEDDEGVVGLPVEQPHPPPIHRHLSRTNLTPDLESVHLSTTANLTVSATAPAELLAAANDLSRRIDSDPTGSPDDEDYWASFPSHIRAFVRNTYAQAVPTGGGGGPGANLNADIAKAQNMYALAQQMVQSGRNGLSKGGVGAGAGAQIYPSGAYSTLPFDPSMFSESGFNLALEQIPMVNGQSGFVGTPAAPGQPPRGPLPPTNVVLLNEFGSEGQQRYEEEYYSEDEVDENVDEVEVDVDVVDGRHRTSAQFTLSYDSGGLYPTAAHGNRNARGVQTAGDANANDEANKKKSRKKKKKGGVTTDGVTATTVTTTTTSPAPPAPNLTAKPPTVAPTPAIPIPAPNPPPAPAANTRPTLPPPSSRAAGKQPMNYSSLATPPAAQNPPLSSRPNARTASKVPPHHHHHHHPSPPSSNASAPNKPRPPATPQAKSNKIWSTSSTEERERIKDFWLGLGEDERRALVKVEKEAVLKKMKEQQKHSCSCAVCGRKR